jgi:CRP/FNR family cyclic AMP-dependent transcriptional regulator
MPVLPSMRNTADKTEALKRRLGFRQFIAQYPCELFSKGQIILFQNETPKGVFVIETGKVRTYTITPDGHEQLISIHSRGEDIPIGFAFGFIERTRFFYEAYTKCVIRIIPKDAFLGHLRSDMDLMHQSHLYSIEQLSSMLSRIHALGQPRASNKVALTLIYLAERLGSRSWVKPKLQELSVTQEEIANLLGMTRETVSCELKKLRINQMISYSRKRYVLYAERIEEYLKSRR